MGLLLKRRLGFYRIARIRSVLNRLTRGRIGLYSPADPYSSKPSFLKRHLGFYRIARIRSVLNRLTRGRIGLYSTAEHYSSGPYAKVLRYYQYDRNRKLRCSVCGWRGTGRSASRNMFDELFDVRCPNCDEMLVVVGYPTLDETRAAAAAGNPRAQERLNRSTHVKLFWTEQKRSS